MNRTPQEIRHPPGLPAWRVRLYRTWLRCLDRRPGWLALAVLLCAVALAIGCQNLYFRGDYKVFFAPDNRQLLDFEHLQRVFNKSDNGSIIVAPAIGTVFDEPLLTLIRQLTDDAWQTPYSTRVDSISNFQHSRAEDDDLYVADLVAADERLDRDAMARVRAIALGEPALVKRMVATDGRVAMINVTVQLPEIDKTAEVYQVAESLRRLTADYQARYPKVAFYHTGVIFMNHAFAAEARRDAITLVPLMLIAILAALWWMLRSVWAMFATLVVVLASVAVALGVAGWSGIFLSTATVNAPTLIMTLAVADCVHVISSLRYALGLGWRQKRAVRYAMRVNLMPVFVTSATTATGFLTMNFSNVPVLRDLGNVTAIGVMAAFVLAMSLLPALLAYLPLGHRQWGCAQRAHWTRWLGTFVIAHYRRILPAGGLLILVLTCLAPFNRVNDEPVKYFDPSTSFRQGADFAAERLAGMASMDFALDSGLRNGINDPAFLRQVEAFGHWLRARPEVDHLSTVVDTVKRLNKNMHGDDPAWYRLPEHRELAAQYLLLYEMSLPFGLDLNNQINVDKSAVRLVATLKNMGSSEYLLLERDARQWLSDQAPAISVRVASPSLMFAHIGELNMRSMLTGLPLALLLISLLLIFALRSWRLGLISLLPNLAPAACGFGVWTMLSGQINLGLSVVAGMSLGIVVDDTVHFLSKYQWARRRGLDAESAVRQAFASVGRALWITTLVLTAGFAVLSLSVFRLNADLGQLTAIILVLALAIDFLILPACLLVFDKGESW